MLKKLTWEVLRTLYLLTKVVQMKKISVDIIVQNSSRHKRLSTVNGIDDAKHVAHNKELIEKKTVDDKKKSSWMKFFTEKTILI